MQSETKATETIQGAVRQTAPWIERVDVRGEPDGFLVVHPASIVPM